MKVYLSGAMNNLTFQEQNGWREKAKWLLTDPNLDNRFECFNPVDYYNYIMDLSKCTEQEIMDFDLWSLRKSDIVLVRLNKDSIGTAIELFEASKLHIPVISFDVVENIHPWIKLCVSKECDTLNDAVEYLKNYYGSV